MGRSGSYPICIGGHGTATRVTRRPRLLPVSRDEHPEVRKRLGSFESAVSHARHFRPLAHSRKNRVSFSHLRMFVADRERAVQRGGAGFHLHRVDRARLARFSVLRHALCMGEVSSATSSAMLCVWEKCPPPSCLLYGRSVLRHAFCMGEVSSPMLFVWGKCPPPSVLCQPGVLAHVVLRPGAC